MKNLDEFVLKSYVPSPAVCLGSRVFSRVDREMHAATRHPIHFSQGSEMRDVSNTSLELLVAVAWRFQDHLCSRNTIFPSLTTPPTEYFKLRSMGVTFFEDL